MQQPSSFLRRILITVAVLIASTAALGFSQSMSATRPAHSSESGVLVISVPSGSPADRAGLARGDIILGIDGSAVNNPRDLREAISSHKQGETISLTVLHGDAQKTLSIALGKMGGSPYLGALLLPDERYRTSMLRAGTCGLEQGTLRGGLRCSGRLDKPGVHGRKFQKVTSFSLLTECTSAETTALTH